MIPESTIQEAVRRIVEAFAPERVIVFGSYPRGDADDGSDLDLLVVRPFKVGETRQDGWLRIERSLGGLEIGRDIVLLTPSEVEQSSRTIGTVAHSARREGRVVCAGAA